MVKSRIHKKQRKKKTVAIKHTASISNLPEPPLKKKIPLLPSGQITAFQTNFKNWNNYLLSFLRKVFHPVWKNLTNEDYCYKCEKEYKNSRDKQKCEYCNKYFCSEHIEAANHSIKCQIKKEHLAKVKKFEDEDRALKNRLEAQEAAIEEDLKKGKYKQSRTNELGICAYCGIQYKDWTDAHQCRYCDGWFCTKHWVPESHDCNGKPERPPGGIREVHHAGGKIDVYGK